ncbi:MAG TPA: hypothetical protein VIK64_12580 [Anaerolineales bacterium]|jgi:hypothetical protein
MVAIIQEIIKGDCPKVRVALLSVVRGNHALVAHQNNAPAAVLGGVLAPDCAGDGAVSESLVSWGASNTVQEDHPESNLTKNVVK